MVKIYKTSAYEGHSHTYKTGSNFTSSNHGHKHRVSPNSKRIFMAGKHKHTHRMLGV